MVNDGSQIVAKFRSFDTATARAGQPHADTEHDHAEKLVAQAVCGPVRRLGLQMLLASSSLIDINPA